MIRRQLYVAAKLLPKFTSDGELEVYLITFKKIALLNKWPKEHWSAILQTQLKGKALRVLAELDDATIKNFDLLEKALLSAFELSSEHYRKKFREMTKAGHENYTEFAFKLQNSFKRWLQSLDCYDKIEELRQTFLKEQFLHATPADMRIWLVDQKPKTVDDMARLSDQYVALQKSVQPCSQTSTTSNNDSVKTVAYAKQDNSKQTTYTKFRDNKKQSFRGFNRKPLQSNHESIPDSQTWCAYCKKNNHTIRECWKLKQKEKESTDKSKSVNATTSSEIHLFCNIADNTVETTLPVHPLFVPYCKTSVLVRPDGSLRSICTLRDTRAMQNLIKENPDSIDFTHTNECRVLKGVTGDTMTVPLVEVHLRTDFIDEPVLCGLVQDLPEGIDFLIGNDIWLKTHPLPDEVTEQAVLTRSAVKQANHSINND